MMKPKIQQTNIILCLVAIAFFIKGFVDHRTSLYFVGLFLVVVTMLRVLLLRKQKKFSLDGEDRILTYLSSDPILYIELFTCYKRGKYKILYDEIDGLMLYDEDCMSYLASAKNLQAARDMVRLLPQDYEIFVGHESIFEEAMKLDGVCKSHLYSYNHVLNRKEPFCKERQEVQVKPLDESYLTLIQEHYKVGPLANTTYVKARIQQGMLGAFVEDTLIGFIGQHASGCIGMLEIFKEYQGQGYASFLECAMIDDVLNKGYPYPIYAQVNKNNKVSLHLQEKLGFQKAKTPTIWYFS